MGATVGIGEHPLVVLDRAIALLRVAIVIIIWRAILATSAAPSAPPPGALLTYVLLAQVLAEQLNARSELLYAIWDGRVATRLLRPMSVFGDYIAEMVGAWGFRWLTFSTPAIAVGAMLGVGLAPHDAWRGVAFVVSVGLSIGVGTAMDFLFAVLVIRSPDNTWSFRMARESLFPILSGAVIPIALFPWQIGRALAWLPFASMVAAPLRVYTGDGDVARLLLLQAAWALALWVMTRRLWERGAARMVSFGG
jgi:ABC-2 type transport system permease protein